MELKLKNKFEKKSPKERFLFVIGVLFFIIYLLMGLAVLFWDKLINRLELSTPYRIALGLTLIIYSFLRFIRFFQNNK